MSVSQVSIPFPIIKILKPVTHFYLQIYYKNQNKFFLTCLFQNSAGICAY